MPSNVNKCHILEVSTRNQKLDDNKMNGVKIESIQYVKDLDVTIVLSLKFSSNAKIPWVKPTECSAL